MSEPGLLIRSLSGRQSARNFHSFVINEIGQGVASGAFALGSILPNDAEMIERYGVSRTVLREALKTLEAKGMVEARAKVGAPASTEASHSVARCDSCGFSCMGHDGDKCRSCGGVLRVPCWRV